MTEHVPVGLNVPAPQYRALCAIAERKHTRVHHLIEGLIATALAGPPAKRPTKVVKPRRTPEERAAQDAEIARMHADGLYDPAIAAALGLNPHTVRARRQHLGLLGHASRPEPLDEGQLRSLHALGLVDRVVAERMGVPQSRILDARHRLDLPKNGAQGRKRKAKP